MGHKTPISFNLRSESTAKHENKASNNTHYVVPNLIDLFGDD